MTRQMSSRRATTSDSRSREFSCILDSGTNRDLTLTPFDSSYISDAANIPTHPRDLPAIARRPDTARKDAREARRIRKAEEKLQREEERKKLKKEKRKELDKKLSQLGVGKDGKGDIFADG